MDTDLIARLWAQALHEGEGVSGVGQRMAQLVAAECANLITGFDPHGDWVMVDGAEAIAEHVRERFGLPPN